MKRIFAVMVVLVAASAMPAFAAGGSGNHCKYDKNGVYSCSGGGGGEGGGDGYNGGYGYHFSTDGETFYTGKGGGGEGGSGSGGGYGYNCTFTQGGNDCKGKGFSGQS